MISIDNISFEFGGRFLYKDTSMQIVAGDRIALIGRNGTGKSTLLRILTGDYRISGGSISKPKKLKIGFLNQELQSYESEKDVLHVALEAFSRQLELREEINDLLQKVADDPSERNLNELAARQNELEALDGYNIETKTQSILAGLGFSEKDQSRPYQEFSGGWRMRVLLARILLEDPDLLLLDEPTNHLDLPSIKWLEDYLRNFKGAYVIVSHDRYFLDRLTETTVELEHQKFVQYKGNYSFFLTEKVKRAELLAARYENQQKQIAETERFINRFRAKASKAKQVQSKIKLLEKLERVQAPESEGASINFSFQPEVRPGKNILHLDLKDKSYDDKQILNDSQLTIMRGDKIALVGANGLGKSTALRIVANTEPFVGEAKLGHNVNPSFFAQHQLEALTPKNDIMEEMGGYVAQKGESFVRSILGGFLFTGDDVFKKVSVLSGGEKSRVALAKTLLSEANFLLLDEPTNHLDIQSIQILISALQQYEGTYIVVSHDRHFLRETANKIWYIEDKNLREFPGTYAEYELSLIHI